MQAPTVGKAADATTFLPPGNRDFALLLAGSSTSMLGSRVSTIAYPLIVLAITGSPVIAGWVCFAAAAPIVLFYIPAGAIVDRCDSRRTMLICESLRGATITSVVAAMIFWHVTVAQLIVAAAVGQTFEVFSTLAERRLTQSLVSSRYRSSALARCEARKHVTVMVGRPLGAVLFATAQILPFVADALSFGACVGTLVCIRKREEPRSWHEPRQPILREIGEGLGWIRDHPFARIALPLNAGTTLIGQALMMIFLGEAHAGHLAYAAIGMILACSGVGGALGAAMGSWLFRSYGYRLFGFELSVWIATFFILALGAWRSFPAAAIAMTVLGFTGALGNITLDMYVFSNASPTILARVMSAGNFIGFGALAVGPLLGGILLKEWGAQIAMIMLLAGSIMLKLGVRVAPLPHSEPQPCLANGRDSTPFHRAKSQLLMTMEVRRRSRSSLELVRARARSGRANLWSRPGGPGRPGPGARPRALGPAARRMLCGRAGRPAGCRRGGRPRRVR
jgi:MFS family permease